MRRAPLQRPGCRLHEVRGKVMRIQRFWMLGVLAAVLSAAAAPAVFAQESPPTRVGRLSYIGGSVSFEPAGTQQWAAAELNWPVTIGDRIWTDWDSRAEIELGDAVVRLDSRTGFSFLNLDAMTAQMQLSAGTIIVHVRALAAGEQDEVDTPNLALSLEQPGTYRVQVDSTGDTTRVEVVSGEALASGGGQTFPVAAQQSATFTGTNSLGVVYATLGIPDAFDDWSMARDREEAQAAAQVTDYVSPDTVGIYDLDTYGGWQDTEWGYAWFPNVVVGWAPYRFGHWVWIAPWGWTWVDDEPWGFAPFHYGRWGYWHNAWCWVPGPRGVRPVYAPGLVAWTHGGHFGGPHRGPHAGGHVGWVPLGPRDVYLPGYAAGRAYVRDINLTNARGLNPAFVTAAYRRGGAGITYANRSVPGAVTAVPRTAFSTSQPADAHRVVLTRRGLLGMRFGAGAPAITPTRASIFGARRRTVQAPPRQLTDRPVIARLVPARAPVSFARQVQALRANGGRALTPQQWARLRPNTPTSSVRLAPDIRPAAPVLQRGPQRSDFAGRPAPIGSPGARLRPAPQSARPVYRADRPAWAQSPVIRRNHPIQRSQPLPQRHVPVPRSRNPQRAPVNRPPRFDFNPGRRTPIPAAPNSAPPMYRPQRSFAPLRANPSFPMRNDYAPPRSPPPMYRPVAPRFTPRPYTPPPAPAFHPAYQPAYHPAPAPAYHPAPHIVRPQPPLR